MGASADEILELARMRGWKLGTAESCTGGLIAARLTDCPGSSDVVELGLVTYSNAAKTSLLGVPADLIDRVGAVSAEVAAAMASGLLERHRQLDLGVAVTGIAGPGGGSAQKPVGLVYIAVDGRHGAPTTKKYLFSGDRQSIRGDSVAAALDMLRVALA